MNRRGFIKKSLLAAALISSGKTFAGEKEDSGEKNNKSEYKGQGVIKKIGLEEHWGNRELGEIMMSWNERTKFPSDNDPSGGLNSSIPRLGDFEKYRLPGMDKNGIAMQVIATGSPGIQGVPETAKAIDLAKRVNDQQAEIVAKYPGRFAAFAALPTQDPKAAVQELERTVQGQGVSVGCADLVPGGHDEEEGGFLEGSQARHDDARTDPCFVAGPFNAFDDIRTRQDADQGDLADFSFCEDETCFLHSLTAHVSRLDPLLRPCGRRVKVSPRARKGPPSQASREKTMGQTKE